MKAQVRAVSDRHEQANVTDAVVQEVRAKLVLQVAAPVESADPAVLRRQSSFLLKR